MNRAIATCFHCYTPFGKEYYQSLYDFYMMQMTKYKDEFDRLYLVDSNWGIKEVPEWATVLNVNPHLRYFDAYKEVLPKIKEDLVLFMDNDMVIYRKNIIDRVFDALADGEKYAIGEKPDVVSIYDTIGKNRFEQLGGQSKFCPYLFATRKDLLMKYRDCDWGPNMPEYETLGKLTEVMLKDGVKPYEIEDDKSNFLFGEELGDRRSKNLGWYHIRSGSTPAYLLSHRERGDKQYWDYLKNQPRSEYLRQFAFYQIMGGDVTPILTDLKIGVGEWDEYIKNFRIFHGL